jgi:hypothetical protein
MNMGFAPDRKARCRERLAFVREYAAWVRRTPNTEWSRQQAALVDSLLLNARNMPLTAGEYLRMITALRSAARR